MAFLHALSLDELAEAAPVRVELDGVPVCLVRIGDSVRALHDMCSHQRWSLSDGEVSGGGVECSLHGSTFDLAPRGFRLNRSLPVGCAGWLWRLRARCTPVAVCVASALVRFQW